MSNNRRRRPLASEREATFAIGFIISILVATSGVVYLLTRTLFRSLNEHLETSGDILAPKRIKSAFDAVMEQLPEFTRGAITIAGLAFLAVPCFSVLVLLDPSVDRLPTLWNMSPEVRGILLFTVFFGGGGIIALLAAGLSYKVYQASDAYQPPVTDDPTHYETIFRKGDTPLFNAEHQYTTYTIRVPRGMEWNAERITRFIEQLVYSFAPLLFRIVADEKSIVWEVVDLHGREPQYIKNAIHVMYPEAHITHKKAHDLEPITSELHRLTLVYKSANSFVHPFRRASDVTDFDPLTTLISAINSLQTG